MASTITPVTLKPAAATSNLSQPIASDQSKTRNKKPQVDPPASEKKKIAFTKRSMEPAPAAPPPPQPSKSALNRVADIKTPPMPDFIKRRVSVGIQSTALATSNSHRNAPETATPPTASRLPALHRALNGSWHAVEEASVNQVKEAIRQGQNIRIGLGLGTNDPVKIQNAQASFNEALTHKPQSIWNSIANTFVSAYARKSFKEGDKAGAIANVVTNTALLALLIRGKDNRTSLRPVPTQYRPRLSQSMQLNPALAGVSDLPSRSWPAHKPKSRTVLNSQGIGGNSNGQPNKPVDSSKVPRNIEYQKEGVIPPNFPKEAITSIEGLDRAFDRAIERDNIRANTQRTNSNGYHQKEIVREEVEVQNINNILKKNDPSLTDLEKNELVNKLSVHQKNYNELTNMTPAEIHERANQKALDLEDQAVNKVNLRAHWIRILREKSYDQKKPNGIN
jgi:hypothetical protein